MIRFNLIGSWSSGKLHDCNARGAAYLAASLSCQKREAMIVSPCEKICVVDPPTGLCLGCGRSLKEIERWMKMTNSERDQVMAELPGRREMMRGRNMDSAAN